MDGVAIGGTRFGFVGAAKEPWSEGYIPVRKSSQLACRMLDLSEEFRGSRILELGIDQGASTCLLLELLDPSGLVAVDINPAAPQPLTRFLADHGHQGRTTLGWGIDQTDGKQIRDLVRARFDRAALDLIIDDASHLLDETTASFEALFGLLRPGGLYLIEDWSWHEKFEIGIAAAIAADGAGELARSVAERAAAAAAAKPRPMSRLSAALALAAAFSPGAIAEVGIHQDWLEVRRGDGPLAPDFTVAELVSPIGREWLGLAGTSR